MSSNYLEARCNKLEEKLDSVVAVLRSIESAICGSSECSTCILSEYIFDANAGKNVNKCAFSEFKY